MIGLVLVTHGRLAVEFRAALEHIVGPQTFIETISIGPDDDVERRRQAREAATAARQRDRMVQTGVRTAGRVITSRAGQDAIRGVFGVLFGKR